MSGKVYLVGAGPGDPELLTMKAARVLRSADVVLHDALVSEDILQMVRPHALLIDVGKRVGQKRITQEDINHRLVKAAAWANIVVRLKGGDPLMFGRAAEEMSSLRRAGIEFEVVPGITAAVAAASEARIALTDRASSAGVIFLTAQQAANKQNATVARVAGQDVTLAIYMPNGQYRQIAISLVAAGKSPATPCLIASNASRAEQDFVWTDLAGLRDIEPPESPSLLIVGEVARRPDQAVDIGWIATVQAAADVHRQ